MKNLISFLVLFICVINISYAQETIEFIDIPIYRDNHNKQLIYDDVLRHSKDDPFGNQFGRITNVHETVHGINSYLRNKYWKLDNKVNGFYAGDGKGIIIKEPSIKMQHIIPYIPESLRSYRYKLYFTKQIEYWNDIPTYIIDEWVAYIFGGLSAIDDHCNNISTEKSDAVSGCLDFSIYVVAMSLAIKKNDPDYWHKYPQFKLTIEFFLKKAEQTFFCGKKDFPFPEQDILLKNLRHNEDCQEIRSFLIQEFNGMFLQINEPVESKKIKTSR